MGQLFHMCVVEGKCCIINQSDLIFITLFGFQVWELLLIITNLVKFEMSILVVQEVQI